MNSLLINLISFALNINFIKLGSKLVGYFDTVDLDDFSTLKNMIKDGKVKEGTRIKSYGQFSRFGHVYNNFNIIPTFSSFSGFNISINNDLLSKSPKRTVKGQIKGTRTFHPVSTIPSFVEQNYNFGFIYPKEFNQFKSFNSSYNKILESGIPVVTKQSVNELSEEIVEFNLTLLKLSEKLLNKLFLITSDQYKIIEANMDNFIFVDIDSSNYIKILSEELIFNNLYYKNIPVKQRPTNLYGSYYASFRILKEENVINFVKYTEEILKKNIRDVYNQIPYIFKQQNRYSIDLGTQKYNLTIGIDGELIVTMPSDFRENYNNNYKEFRILCEYIYSNICEYLGNSKFIYLEFIHDFEYGIELENQILKGEFYEQIIENRPGLIECVNWLRERYNSKSRILTA